MMLDWYQSIAVSLGTFVLGIVPDPLFHEPCMHVRILAEEETFQMWAKVRKFPEMVRYPQASWSFAKRHSA